MKKLLIAAAVFLATSAQAGVVVAPTAVVGGNMGQYSGTYSYTNMLNQSGLSSNYVSGTTDFDTFLSSTVSHSGGDSLSWLSQSGVYSGYLVFDLGAVYNVSKLVLWNGTSGVSASPNNFSLSTSLTSDFAVSNAAGAFVGNMSYNGTVYDMADTSAQFVRMNISGNFGNGCCVGIGDIAFDATPGQAVPEPASMALLGLGMAGLAWSRRRATQTRK